NRARGKDDLAFLVRRTGGSDRQAVEHPLSAHNLRAGSQRGDSVQGCPRRGNGQGGGYAPEGAGSRRGQACQQVIGSPSRRGGAPTGSELCSLFPSRSWHFVVQPIREGAFLPWVFGGAWFSVTCMAEPRKPSPVLLLVAGFSRQPGALAWARVRLQELFGPVALVSPAYDFNQTAYYERTMGT